MVYRWGWCGFGVLRAKQWRTGVWAGRRIFTSELRECSSATLTAAQLQDPRIWGVVSWASASRTLKVITGETRMQSMRISSTLSVLREPGLQAPRVVGLQGFKVRGL